MICSSCNVSWPDDEASLNKVLNNCYECKLEYGRRWRKLNRAYSKAYRDKYYRANRDKLIEDAKAREKVRRFERHGLTKETYTEMVESQGGLCAICGKPPKSGKTLDIDHCHATGRVRGALCNLCNQGLGYFKDDPDVLNNAINYLTLQEEVTKAVMKHVGER